MGMHHILREPEFWVLVSFCIFFALFGSRLWAAIAGMLDARANAVRAELAEAQRLREEAEAMLADAQRARTEAMAEAGELLARSHTEAARLQEAAMADAQAAGKRREKLAMDRISAAEKAALTEVRQTAADVATRAAEQVLAQGLGDTDQVLIDQAIADLPRALRAA
jgi:F-type H+-transporting ATPase subunit b